LYAPVAVMEQASVVGTLKRARQLANRIRSAVLIITLLQFALPLLVWIASVDSTFAITFDDQWSPTSFNVGFSMSDGSAFYQLANILVTPLSGIMTAQLYLKTRRAGGEVLRDAVEPFEALEIPRSR